MNKEKRELCDRCGEEHTLTQGCEYPPSPAIKFGELTQNKEKKEIEERFKKRFDGYWRGEAIPDEILFFFFKELDSYANKKVSEALNYINRKMKIAAMIKPKDKTGILVWLDEQTLTESDEINLIDGKELKAFLSNK